MSKHFATLDSDAQFEIYEHVCPDECCGWYYRYLGRGGPYAEGPFKTGDEALARARGDYQAAHREAR